LARGLKAELGTLRGLSTVIGRRKVTDFKGIFQRREFPPRRASSDGPYSFVILRAIAGHMLTLM
jgi:hypothetical protein